MAVLIPLFTDHVPQWWEVGPRDVFGRCRLGFVHVRTCVAFRLFLPTTGICSGP